MKRSVLTLALALVLSLPATGAEIVGGVDLKDGLPACEQWTAARLDSEAFGYVDNVVCVRIQSYKSGSIAGNPPGGIYHCRRKISDGVTCSPPN